MTLKEAIDRGKSIVTTGSYLPSSQDPNALILLIKAGRLEMANRKNAFLGRHSLLPGETKD